MRFGNRKKVGLALGGGGARGWAHLGVIKAFGEAGLSVDCVAGTSMGAPVGGVFAAGHVEALWEAALNLDWKKMIYYFSDVAFHKAGIIDGAKIVNFISKNVSQCAIESLPIRFSAVATNIMTGEETVIGTGDLMEAIRASIAIPGMFTPAIRNGVILADGGLVNPVPVNVVRAMGAEVVIAVDLNFKRVGGERLTPTKEGSLKNPEPHKADVLETLRSFLPPAIARKLADFDLKKLSGARRWLEGPNIFDLLGNSLRIMEAQITEIRLKIEPPDILIRPRVGHINFMEFNNASEAVQAGYEAANEQLLGHASLFQ